MRNLVNSYYFISPILSAASTLSEARISDFVQDALSKLLFVVSKKIISNRSAVIVNGL